MAYLEKLLPLRYSFKISAGHLTLELNITKSDFK